jgi:hypothetical protein
LEWEVLVTIDTMTFTPLFLHLILVFYIIDYVLDDRVSIPGKGEIIFPLAVVSMTSSGAHPASCIMGTGGPFPGGKAHPGRYADHSLPSSAEVVNEYELYILYLQAPPWRVAGLLYFFDLISDRNLSSCRSSNPACGMAVPILCLHLVPALVSVSMVTNDAETNMKLFHCFVW